MKKSTFFAALVAVVIVLLTLTGCQPGSVPTSGIESVKSTKSIESMFWDEADNGTKSWDYQVNVYRQDKSGLWVAGETMTTGELSVHLAGWRFANYKDDAGRFPAALHDPSGVIYVAKAGHVYAIGELAPEKPKQVGDVIDATATRANDKSSVSYALGDFVYELQREGKTFAEIEPLLLEKWNEEFRFYLGVAEIGEHLDPGSAGRAASSVTLRRWGNFRVEKGWQKVSNTYYDKGTDSFKPMYSVPGFDQNGISVSSDDRIVATIVLDNGIVKEILVECFNEIKKGEIDYTVQNPWRPQPPVVVPPAMALTIEFVPFNSIVTDDG